MSLRFSGRDGVLVLLALLLAATAALWWFVVAPARDERAGLKRDLAALSAEVNRLGDGVDRLRAEQPDASRSTAERLRLAKAMPVGDRLPGAMLQLQELAEGSGVHLLTITPGAEATHGAVRSRDVVVEVSGRYRDVDDFLYRLHHLVRIDDRDRVAVRGRLLAVRDIKLGRADGVRTLRSARTRLTGRTLVEATMTVVAYTAPANGDDAAPQPVSAKPTPVDGGAGPAATPAQAGSPPAAPATSPAPPATPPAPGDSTAQADSGGMG